jgi:hypothetical protein
MTLFKKDEAAPKALSQTAKLADVKSSDFDTGSYPDGHGSMWPIALVFHFPGVIPTSPTWALRS